MGRTCIVFGCWSSDYAFGKKKFKKEKEGKLSFFMPPRDLDLFEKWKKVIPTDELRKTDCICELHFLEDDIERFYITKLKDGTIDKIEKGRKTLRVGAIPSIFPNPLEIVEEEKLSRKRSTTHHVVETPDDNMSSAVSTAYHVLETPKDNISSVISSAHHIVKTPDYNMSSAVSTAHRVLETPKDNISSTTSSAYHVGESPEDNMSSTVSLPEEKIANFSYETLLTTVMSLKKPNIYWSITPTPTFIVCARWNQNYVAEKRIVIEKNLNARVFFRETELKDTDLLEITDDDDLSTLLQEVESYKICAGASDKSRKNCLLCWKSEVNVGRRRIWCKNCRDVNRNKARNTKRTVLNIIKEMQM